MCRSYDTCSNIYKFSTNFEAIAIKLWHSLGLYKSQQRSVLKPHSFFI